MLVLTRTLGEEIVIDGNIRIRVCDVKGGRVKIAVEAPPEVAIRRAEILAKVREAFAAAS